MRLTTEEQQKKCIASKQVYPVYLLFGNDSELLLSYRKKLCEMLVKLGCEQETMDGKALDLSSLYDAAQLVSFFGGRRLIVIKDFDAEALIPTDCNDLCDLISELSDNVTVVFAASPESFDIKKGKNAKKLLSAADKAGVAVQLDRRDAASLKATLRSRCQKRGCELSNEAAAFLIERCGNDMATLLNECDKLCAFADGSTITNDMITAVSSGTLSADPYALSRLMLRGELTATLDQIDSLIRMRQPVTLIISNISSAFCSIARACAARSAGKNCDSFQKDFGFKFEWMAQNAFRDSAKLTQSKAFEICQIFSDAETQIKSTPLDERILLETAVVRAVQTLGGGR